MKTHAIVKTHEAALKGKNRPMFMRRLADNLRRAVKGAGVDRVWLGHLIHPRRCPSLSFRVFQQGSHLWRDQTVAMNRSLELA